MVKYFYFGKNTSVAVNIDFYRFPLSIGKNHLILINFYRNRFLSTDYVGVLSPGINVCLSVDYNTLQYKEYNALFLHLSGTCRSLKKLVIMCS